jgi:nucleoside-diphosphate-sugar epimerase
MKIVISGYSGFVGENLVAALSKEFEEIQCVSLRGHWKSLLTNDSDVYIHLAGKAHDHNCVASEDDYFKINYELTKEFFEFFLKSNAKLFIYFSSISVIEEEGSNELIVEDKIPNPKSAYGRSKRKAEEFLIRQNITNCKKIVVLRPTMIHGPGDKGNLKLLYNLISKGIPYPLAKFDNQRSFLSIENLNFFIKEIIDKQDNIKSGVYNLCDDTTVSTSEIIKLIGEITNVRIVNLQLPKFIIKKLVKLGDFLKLPLNTKRFVKMTSNLSVSNEKIKLALGIDQLPLSAREGLIKTIQSFKIEK